MEARQFDELADNFETVLKKYNMDDIPDKNLGWKRQAGINALYKEFNALRNKPIHSEFHFQHAWSCQMDGCEKSFLCWRGIRDRHHCRRCRQSICEACSRFPTEERRTEDRWCKRCHSIPSVLPRERHELERANAALKARRAR